MYVYTYIIYVYIYKFCEVSNLRDSWIPHMHMHMHTQTLHQPSYSTINSKFTPTPVFLSGESHGQRNLAEAAVCGIAKVGYDLTITPLNYL